jgi:hypothetical protein
MLETLRVGKEYKFQFTHRKNVHGIVCDVDKGLKQFVVYDTLTKEYENIPEFRLKSFESKRK